MDEKSPNLGASAPPDAEPRLGSRLAAGFMYYLPSLLVMLALVRTLKARRWQVLKKIRFPNAVPYIFVGLKLAATMSVIGALVGEFVASERGLGSLIITGGVTMQTASIFASLMLISALGLVLYGLVVVVERIVAPWAHRSDAAD